MDTLQTFPGTEVFFFGNTFHLASVKVRLVSVFYLCDSRFVSRRQLWILVLSSRENSLTSGAGNERNLRGLISDVGRKQEVPGRAGMPQLSDKEDIDRP